MCKKIISRSDFTYLFSQIGLFSLFLLPPIYPLVRYAISLLYEENFNKTEFSLCVGAVFLLLVLLFAAAYSVFKITFTQDNK